MSKDSTYIVSKKEYDLLANSVKLAKSYTDLIQHHVATRVELFFLKTIACYRTPYRYEIGDTEGQIFDAKTLKVKTNNKADPELKIGYQAAHSSTIPSLKACPIKDYEEAKIKGKEPQYSSFLEGSHLEMLDNSTVGLPTFVNQIDTLIDGKANNGALRSDAINLINEVAKGKITPCGATRKFLACFLNQLEERPETSKNLTLAKQKTISIYKKKVEEMIRLAETPDDVEEENAFFDNLLSNNFSGASEEDLPKLRKIFYKQKFKIIRESQFTETKINTIITGYFPKAIKPTDKHDVRLCLTFKTKNDPILSKILQKLFAVSIRGMEKDVKLYRQLKQMYDSEKDNYNKALRDIRATVRSFQNLEQGFQAELLKDFRTKLRGLTQKKLAEKIDAEVNKEVQNEVAKERPDARKIIELSSTPKSASTISRLENSRIHIIDNCKTPVKQRRKNLTSNQAKLISKALEVDPDYFFCSFFASKSPEN